MKDTNNYEDWKKGISKVAKDNKEVLNIIGYDFNYEEWNNCIHELGEDDNFKKIILKSLEDMEI
jgi:hypothetical protein